MISMLGIQIMHFKIIKENNREGGDIGQEIILVPKVLLKFLPVF